jgi:IS5 family transposase
VAPPQGTRLLLTHTRGLPPARKKLLKRRRAIEPSIGHMKTDGLLARNWLKGSQDDVIHPVLCGAGHNPRLILAHLRVLLSALIGLIVLGQIGYDSPRLSLNTTA